MSKTNKKAKHNKKIDTIPTAHKKSLQKNKDLSLDNFLQELQQELESYDNQRLFDNIVDEDVSSAEEEITNFFKVIDFLSPKEIAMLLNSMGGDFSSSEAKAIKKFVLFTNNFDESVDYELDDHFVEITNRQPPSTKMKDDKVIPPTNRETNKKMLKNHVGKQIKQSTGNEEDVYVFKANFGTATRIIGLSSEQSLHDLHLAIQQYFEWDDDHLYSFFMDNKPYSKYSRYNHPMSADPPFANEIEIKKLKLKLNKRFLYLFDFGDENFFELELLEKKSKDSFESQNFPLLISKKGKNPSQYNPS